jgi:DNA-binding IclR family transcriptional regulator
LAYSPGGLLDLALADPRTWLPGANAPDKSDLLAELHAIAQRGYARNRDALRLGVSSVAIPVFDAASRAVATCSIAYPTGRGGKEAETRLAHMLMQRGRDISEAMGGAVPPDVQAIWTPSRERAAS